jgi:hypothetical protein
MKLYLKFMTALWAGSVLLGGLVIILAAGGVV